MKRSLAVKPAPQLTSRHFIFPIDRLSAQSCSGESPVQDFVTGHNQLGYLHKIFVPVHHLLYQLVAGCSSCKTHKLSVCMPVQNCTTTEYYEYKQ
jgi:hypothetical protein